MQKTDNANVDRLWAIPPLGIYQEKYVDIPNIYTRMVTAVYILVIIKGKHSNMPMENMK